MITWTRVSPRGKCATLQHEKHPNLLALSYNDRAKCHFFTNLFRPEFTDNRKNQTIPSVVDDYRHYIGSLDRVDRSARLACWPHKSSRWTMAFLWYLLGLCVSNARLILAGHNNVSYNLSDFLVDLIGEWRSELDTKKKSTTKARSLWYFEGYYFTHINRQHFHFQTRSQQWS